MATTVRKNDITFTITTPEDVQQDRKRHKTEPIPGSLTAVPRYPDPLKIYKQAASPYWWVRYFHKGKIHRKSTKTTSKAEALGIAKDFYTSIITGQHAKEQEEGVVTFAIVAEGMMKAKEAQMARKALTKITYSNTDYRLKKFILPHLGHRDIRSISYDDLEDLLSLLSHQGIKGSTIASYMKIARSVFVYASKSKDKIITSIPQFPTVRSEHDARGYFTKEEYHTLLVRARELIGKRFEYRKLKDAHGKELPGQYFAEGTCADGRFINRTTITQELVDLIQFMTNSYVRPTDIKNLQHKHVTIVRKEHTYLRLNPPPTKGHKDPFVTMEKAVEVYERLTEFNKSSERDTGPEAYVFFPNYEKRDHALKMLERQFAVLMWDLGMGKGAKGESRTMYSLRHTCFMFRLMYGENIDLLTLARNGRTSPEMINKHYASQLTGEHNIDMLQSQRNRGKAA
jgi:hypothetical protein